MLVIIKPVGSEICDIIAPQNGEDVEILPDKGIILRIRALNFKAQRL